MSLSKILGTVVGGLVGVAIASMILSATLESRSAPALDVVAIILIGAFLGATLGAFIGSDDRRRRIGSNGYGQPLTRDEIAVLRERLHEEHAQVGDGPRAPAAQ